MKTIYILLFGMLNTLGIIAQKINPIPTKQQLQWQQQEFYLFTHFGPNTFTGNEWGSGSEEEEIFNPKQLDCRQWARIAKAAGAKGIIITAKHHDGFCLWPSKYSTHTVRESKWKDGKGDVLKELSSACKEYGLSFGVYLSPWDRNHPLYGTAAYNDVFVNMMTEIFTQYGPITELWWDGANGEGPNGKKQVYDWQKFIAAVRKLSPHTVVFSDVGPDIRWVGNENGIAGITNWNLLNIAGFKPGADAPSTDTLNRGNMYGSNWIPAECDVSIRPGWFYHSNENDKVKTPEQLFRLYIKSVGRGANLLLNVPPDDNGLIHGNDSASLMGFKKLRTKNFGENIALTADKKISTTGKTIPNNLFADGKINTSVTLPVGIQHKLLLQFHQSTVINCIVLKESISKGQQISKGKIRIYNGVAVVKEISFTTIGSKRIICFPSVTASSLSVQIEAAKAMPSISEVEIYKMDDALLEEENN